MARFSALEIEKVIHDIEFENQQYVKQIDKERQEIETIEKGNEIVQLEIKAEEEKTPQLDECIKTYHKHFISNRNNIENLRRTWHIMHEHGEVLRKRLEMQKIKRKGDDEERKKILDHYENIWKGHKSCYCENFPAAENVEKMKTDIAQAEELLVCALKHQQLTKENLNVVNSDFTSDFQVYTDLNKFIVEVSKLYSLYSSAENSLKEENEKYLNSCSEYKELELCLKKQEEERAEKLRQEKLQQEIEERKLREQAKQQLAKQQASSQPNISVIRNQIRVNTTTAPKLPGQVTADNNKSMVSNGSVMNKHAAIQPMSLLRHVQEQQIQKKLIPTPEVKPRNTFDFQLKLPQQTHSKGTGYKSQVGTGKKIDGTAVISVNSNQLSQSRYFQNLKLPQQVHSINNTSASAYAKNTVSKQDKFPNYTAQEAKVASMLQLQVPNSGGTKGNQIIISNNRVTNPQSKCDQIKSVPSVKITDDHDHSVQQNVTELSSNNKENNENLRQENNLSKDKVEVIQNADENSLPEIEFNERMPKTPARPNTKTPENTPNRKSTASTPEVFSPACSESSSPYNLEKYLEKVKLLSSKSPGDCSLFKRRFMYEKESPNQRESQDVNDALDNTFEFNNFSFQQTEPRNFMGGGDCPKTNTSEASNTNRQQSPDFFNFNFSGEEKSATSPIGFNFSEGNDTTGSSSPEGFSFGVSSACNTSLAQSFSFTGGGGDGGGFSMNMFGGEETQKDTSQTDFSFNFGDAKSPPGAETSSSTFNFFKF